MSILMLLFTSLMCKRVCLKASVPMAQLNSICACVKCSWTTGFQVILMLWHKMQPKSPKEIAKESIKCQNVSVDNAVADLIVINAEQ